MLVLDLVYKMPYDANYLHRVNRYFLRLTSIYKLHHNIIYCSCFTMLIFRYLFFFSVSMISCFSHGSDLYGEFLLLYMVYF